MDDQAYQVRHLQIIFKVINERLLKRCSGYICIGLPGERLDELDIRQMVPENEDRNKTAYTVTVDYKHGASMLSHKLPHLISLSVLVSQISFRVPTFHLSVSDWPFHLSSL